MLIWAQMWAHNFSSIRDSTEPMFQFNYIQFLMEENINIFYTLLILVMLSLSHYMYQLQDVRIEIAFNW